MTTMVFVAAALLGTAYSASPQSFDCARAQSAVEKMVCADFNDNVTYTNINEKSGFVAVYAGATEAEARKVLAQARAAGYAGANLRRMEVIVVSQIE